jgi:hypothetical protein
LIHLWIDNQEVFARPLLVPRTVQLLLLLLWSEVVEEEDAAVAMAEDGAIGWDAIINTTSKRHHSMIVVECYTS